MEPPPRSMVDRTMVLSLALLPSTALAEPTDVLLPHRVEVPLGRVERVVAAARQHLGEPYRWEGRGTQRLPGYDCLGILFRAFGRVDGRSWWTYEVDPSELVQGGKLGRAPEGLAGVLRESLDPDALVAGDVLYFLWADHRIPDEPLWVHDGVQYWPWHTGLYLGSGQVLHARPGAEVMEQPLDQISFDALYVTR